MVDSSVMSVEQHSSKSSKDTRLVVDSMLGSMARKLRFFGFDTLYYNSIDDSSLLDVCLREGRVLVTMDEELHRRAENLGIKSILVNSSYKGSVDLSISTMEAILKALGVSCIRFNAEHSRCSLCNSKLEYTDKHMLKGLVHDNILALYERFYICRGCNKVYWEGSHVKRLKEFAKEVNARLAYI